jgi:siderophore synthetase component
MTASMQGFWTWSGIRTIQRRVLRQLIQSLIHEEMIIPAAEEEAHENFVSLTIPVPFSGFPVHYACKAKKSAGFQRYRLLKDAVTRISQDKAEEASIRDFILDFKHLFVNQDDISSFLNELEQTCLNDSLATWHQLNDKLQSSGNKASTIDLNNYEELESSISDGHPYHPSYKSRVGFSLLEHEHYAPEFSKTFQLIWIAVHKRLAVVSVSQSIEYNDMIKAEIGIQQFQRFIHKIKDNGKIEDDYIFIPIHPWQWDQTVQRCYYNHFITGEMIYLGTGEDRYRSQQSIRTLTNVSNARKAYVKTALNLTNTSAKRIIAPHHAQNAPVLSDWLFSILERDDSFQRNVRLSILREVMGVTVRYEHYPSEISRHLYGSMGAIWRENIHVAINQGESVLPFTAMGHIDFQEIHLLQSWINAYGIEDWIRQLLKVTIKPFLHLLYKYGIGVEAHAQNTLLIHREGLPLGIIIRDLPGGIVCLNSELLGHRPCLPAFIVRDEDHSTIRNGILTYKAEDARDYFMDAFFHIFLNELAHVFEETYNFCEVRFWQAAVSIILEYQQEHPELSASFNLFNLFAETIEVGHLTAQKMLGKHSPKDHVVNNPLFHALSSVKPLN